MRARWVSVLSSRVHWRDSVRLRAASAARSARAAAWRAGSASAACTRCSAAACSRASSPRAARSTLASCSWWPRPARSTRACCRSAIREASTSAAWSAAVGLPGQFGQGRGDREPGRLREARRVGLQQGAVVVGDAPPPRVRVDLGEREDDGVDALAGGDQEGRAPAATAGRTRRPRTAGRWPWSTASSATVVWAGSRPPTPGVSSRLRYCSSGAGWVTSMRRAWCSPVAHAVRSVISTGSPAPGSQARAAYGPGHELQVGGGGDGGVDRGQAGYAEQRVDQGALAAFGFADDHDAGADQPAAAQVGQFGAGVGVGGAQVGEGVADRGVEHGGQLGAERRAGSGPVGAHRRTWLGEQVEAAVGDLGDAGLGGAGAGDRVRPATGWRRSSRRRPVRRRRPAAAAGSSGGRRRWPGGSARPPSRRAAARCRRRPAGRRRAAAAGGRRGRAAAAWTASRSRSRSGSVAGVPGEAVQPGQRPAGLDRVGAPAGTSVRRVLPQPGQAGRGAQPADQVAGAQPRVGGELGEGETDAVQVEAGPAAVRAAPGPDRGGPGAEQVGRGEQQPQLVGGQAGQLRAGRRRRRR